VNDATAPKDVTAQVKQMLTIEIVDWLLTEHLLPQDQSRKRLQVSGTVQSSGAAYACDIRRFNRVVMEGIDANGCFFRLTRPSVATVGRETF
jgi:hypothetical protein